MYYFFDLGTRRLKFSRVHPVGFIFQLPQLGHGETGTVNTVALYSAKGDVNLQLQSLHLNLPFPVIISSYPPSPVPLWFGFFNYVIEKAWELSLNHPTPRYRQITHCTDN